MKKIEIDNISYEYHKGRKVFENFFLELYNGETTFLIGKNGSGKTTLTKLIMGIHKPSSGQIKIFGKNTKEESLATIGQMIGYVFQYPERQLFSPTVMEELTFPLLFKGANKEETTKMAEEMLKIFDLEKVKNSYPFFLSYGEKRRLAIASVLMIGPKYLILDEPTASLDKERIEGLSEVLNELKLRKIGMLIISHKKDFIERHSDRLIELKGVKFMNDIDPRTKLIQVLILSTLALIYNKLSLLSLILFAAIVIACLNKINLVSILIRFKKLVKMIIIIALVQSLLTKTGNPIFKIGNFTLLTDYGLVKSLEFILRLGIIIVSAAIITTSSSREIIQGLIQWHCPYEIAFMVSVAIRFLPIFKEEMTDMITAIQLRGIDLHKVKLNKKIQVYKYILTPITINSVIKAKELAAAMEMRGFRAYSQRSSYMVLKMEVYDYIIIGLSLAAAFFAVSFTNLFVPCVT